MTEKSILSQLRELPVGGTLVVPIEKRSSVKTTVSTFAIQWNKRFTCRSDREKRLFTVTRIA